MTQGSSLASQGFSWSICLSSSIFHHSLEAATQHWLSFSECLRLILLLFSLQIFDAVLPVQFPLLHMSPCHPYSQHLGSSSFFKDLISHVPELGSLRWSSCSNSDLDVTANLPPKHATCKIELPIASAFSTVNHDSMRAEILPVLYKTCLLPLAHHSLHVKSW